VDSVRAVRLNWKDMIMEANKKGGANLKKGSGTQEEKSLFAMEVQE
jgi:hypothetical protein